MRSFERELDMLLDYTMMSIFFGGDTMYTYIYKQLMEFFVRNIYKANNYWTVRSIKYNCTQHCRKNTDNNSVIQIFYREKRMKMKYMGGAIYGYYDIMILEIFYGSLEDIKIILLNYSNCMFCCCRCRPSKNFEYWIIASFSKF